MGVTRLLDRLAAAAPPRVFAVAGRGGGEPLAALRAQDGLSFVDSPRSADVILAVGETASGLLRPTLAVHDLMAHPRATVCWPLARSHCRLDRLLPGLTVVHGDTATVRDAVIAAHRELQLRRRQSEPAVLPDVDPAPWRRVGPYGQGGQGMTGGVPYGRPMAGRAPDRDGLELDQLPLRLGPFLPPLPAGLALDVRLQGDVVQEVAVGPVPWRGLPATLDSPFTDALRRPVRVAVLERARAASHLRWLAATLHLHGLAAWEERAWQLALRLADADGPDLESDALALLAAMDGRRLPGATLRWAMRGLGTLVPDEAEARALGPVARAAGIAADARADSDVYAELGFAVHTESGADAWARLRQRLAEVVQSLDLSARAGDVTVGRAAEVEGPRGLLVPGRPGPSAILLTHLPDVLAGLEWGDAMTVLASLDIDVDDAYSAPAGAHTS